MAPQNDITLEAANSGESHMTKLHRFYQFVQSENYRFFLAIWLLVTSLNLIYESHLLLRDAKEACVPGRQPSTNFICNASSRWHRLDSTPGDP